MNKIPYILLAIFIVLCSVSVSFVAAYTESGHIALLTVSESANSSYEKGGVADLYLTIKQGTGRIFIDSFPLSKVDTQITTRFATELACDFLDKDCSGLDFFYTIRANSAIVGGPSAGAASTVLTIAMLDEQVLDDKTVMTGTINSGNLIGPVAGISAKTLAAQNHGFKKALIPKWDAVNDTPSSDLTIKIVQVSTLEEALFEFTAKNYSSLNDNITLSEQYREVMKSVALDLCKKYGTIDAQGILLMPNLTRILSEYNLLNLTIESSMPGNISNSTTNNSFRSIQKDFFGLAKDSMDRKEYYSAASFCFGGNVRVTSALFSNLSNTDLKIKYVKLLGDISDFEQMIDEKKITTISDLETYMVVTERLLEAKDALTTMNPENISSMDIAYPLERFETAKIWSKFFNMSGPAYNLDSEQLKKVCSSKISEAEERVNYLQLFLPAKVDRKDLAQAYEYLDNDKYALCIFTASKAKADVDVVLGAIYVSEINIPSFLDEKLTAARKSIAKQEQHKIFPILGYSYYEYATSLSRTDKYSALIYAENALELSNLDMYFPKEKKFDSYQYISLFEYRNFFLGFAAGIIFVVIVASISAKFKPKDKDIVNKSARQKKSRKTQKRK